jgi:hypothetical protein
VRTLILDYRPNPLARSLRLALPLQAVVLVVATAFPALDVLGWTRAQLVEAVVLSVVVFFAVELGQARTRVWASPTDVLLEWRGWFRRGRVETVDLARIASVDAVHRRMPGRSTRRIYTQERLIFRLIEGRILPVSVGWESFNKRYRERAMAHLRVSLRRPSRAPLRVARSIAVFD